MDGRAAPKVELEYIDEGHPLWESLYRSRDANLQALTEHHPQLAHLLQAHSPWDEYRLFCVGGNRFGVEVRADPAVQFFLTDYDDLHYQLRQAAHALNNAGFITLCGVGIGETLGFFAEHWNKAGRRRLLVVEGETSLFQIALMFVDLRDLLSHPESVSLCVGGEALDCALHMARQAGIGEAPSPILLSSVLYQNTDFLGELTRGLAKLQTGKPVPSGLDGGLDHWDPSWQEQTPTEEQLARYRANREILAEHPYLYAEPDILEKLDATPFRPAKNQQGQELIPLEPNPLSPGDRRCLWRPTPESAEARFRKLQDDDQPFSTPALVGGSDGQLLERLLVLLSHRGPYENYRRILYLFEPSLYAFKALMHLADFGILMNDGPRVNMFIGTSAKRRLYRYLVDTPTVRFPNLFLALEPHTNDGHLKQLMTLVDEARENLIQQTKRITLKMAAHYREITPAQWLDRLSSARPLRILCFSSRMTSFLQHCSRDLIAGFNALGHDARLIVEDTQDDHLNFVDMARMTNEFRPDLVFILDHMRQEYDFLPENLPYVCWLQDMLESVLQPRGYQLSELDFMYVLVESWIDALRALNPTFENAEIEPLAVGINDDIYHPLDTCPKTVDLCFVTHLPATRDTLQCIRQGDFDIRLDHGEQELVDEGIVDHELLTCCYSGLAKEVDAMSLDDLTCLLTGSETNRQLTLGLIERGLKRTDAHPPEELIECFAAHRSRLKRDIIVTIKSRPLLALAGEGLRMAIYGNNWDQFEKLRPYWRGIAGNGEELNRIMNSSHININNSGGISFHMRALEIMGSGNFMLTRRVTNDGNPITDHFEEGREVVLFDERDLPDKVRHFLANPDQAAAVSQAARDKVLANYSYRRIAERILARITDRLQDLAAVGEQTDNV